MEGVPRLGFIRRAAAAAALRREITRGPLKRAVRARYDSNVLLSLYAYGSAYCTPCAPKERVVGERYEGGEEGTKRERDERGLCCVRVFEEKHISLLLLPPSLFFLPADLHSRWVGLLLLLSFRSISFSLSARVFLPAPPPPFPLRPLFTGGTGKIQPRERARCSLFTRTSPREIARRAQEPRKRSERIY